MSDSPPPTPRTGQPRLRFTLRLLLAFVTLLCIGLGIWTHRAREQRRLIDSIKSRGGSVHYDIQGWGYPPTNADSNIPRWLLDLLGYDYFHEVTEVTLVEPTLLSELARLPKLECLTVANRDLTDASVAPIARLRRLKALSIYPNAPGPAVTCVGDESLNVIAELPALELANVLGSRITPKGLEALAHSRSLRRLQIVSYDSSIDEQAAETFRRAGHANVHIQRWSPNGGGKVVAEFRP